jgi:hypothetical protein
LDAEQSWSTTHPVTIDVLRSEILAKMQQFETQTWGEIIRDRERNHPVAVEDMAPEAQRRIERLGLDVDGLFRFRLDGQKRLWGIRDCAHFKIVWWDPEHKVCPSIRRHT